jgi:type IV secretion system protein VirB10
MESTGLQKSETPEIGDAMRTQILRLVKLGAILASMSLASFAAAQTQEPQPAAQQKSPGQQAADAPKAKPIPGKVVVPAGTHLPLVLHNAITTRNAKPSDPVYLETLFPVVVESRIVIPAGSYVSGEVVEAKRPGRVKGRAELLLRLTTMILPNGYTVDFTAVPRNASTGGNESVEEEGRMKGDSDKASDVGPVVRAAAIGGAIGTVAGAAGRNVPVGAAAGLGAGLAAGLAAVLTSRGPELELPRGTTLDVALDRPLYLDADKVQFTDPGRASTLAGPPSRQPVRNRVPF